MSYDTQKDEPIVLLDLFMLLLNVLYRSFVKISGTNFGKWGKKFFSSSRNGEHNENIFNEQSDLDDRIEAAYKFMELEPPVEVEELSKKYKRLSLKYHPDRCGGSEESKDMFQRLNACYELLKEHLDKESNANEGQHGPSTGDHNHTEEDDDWEDRFRAQCEEREKYEKEMERKAKEAWANHRKEMSEFQKRKKAARKNSKKKKKKNKLYTDAARDRAHKEFCRQAEAFEQRHEEGTASPQDMGDIDDDHVQSRGKKSSQREETKPQNLLMESNVDDDLALALKMGCFEVSVSIFLSRYDQQKFSFTSPLDADGNTVAHYAIYFESYDFLGFLCDYLYHEHTKQLKSLFTYENKRGQSSLYYATLIKDKRIKELIETKIRMAEDLIARNSSFRSRVNTAGTW
eukprot:CAMPEP_0178969590 /NCGR_PEP_ID=MMETSP0789-20121207/18960_1 /TAXON_ID=3005 /ORGANISM="Rhizosolenia setigera, Strain CCMP 1694" /LENGTH=401 /DNA_ID=CAMNT_0020655779 /DNA_START=112 /DNA_END=1314 /DNA_ORIENTATION=+